MTINSILEEIINLAKKYSASTVILFGSRAKGTATERSDIDIAVSGIPDTENLREELDNLPTLYTIDLVNLDECGNQLLLEDIRKYGREIYKRFESFKNSLAHDYDGTIVTNCCQTIIHVYIDKLYDYQKK